MNRYLGRALVAGVLAILVAGSAGSAENPHCQTGAAGEADTARPRANRPEPPKTQEGAHYDQGFVVESVTQTPKSGGESKAERVVTTLRVKGRKSRFDGLSGFTSIYDGATGENVYIFHDVRQYRRETAEQRKKAAEGPDEFGLRKLLKLPKPTATGKKRKIDGHTAEGYQQRGPDGGTDITLWVVKDYPHYDEILKRMNGAQDETRIWNQSDARPPGFVIRSERQAKGGGRIVSTQAVRAEAVDDSVFEIPEGYTEQVGD